MLIYLVTLGILGLLAVGMTMLAHKRKKDFEKAIELWLGAREKIKKLNKEKDEVLNKFIEVSSSNTTQKERYSLGKVYVIMDIEAWCSKEKINNGTTGYSEFKNGDLVVVAKDEYDCLVFKPLWGKGNSKDISYLKGSRRWHSAAMCEVTKDESPMRKCGIHGCRNLVPADSDKPCKECHDTWFFY